MDVEMRKRVPGRVFATAGFVAGIAASIAANVMHSYLPPKDAAPNWHPAVGAVVEAAWWPCALLLCIEVIARVPWPAGRAWLWLRYGGLTTVASIAALVSYTHMSALLVSYNESPVVVYAGPLAVDGLMVVCSGALIAIGRRLAQESVVPEPRPFLPQPEPVAAPVSPEPVRAPSRNGKRGPVATTAELYDRARAHYLAAVADGKTVTGAELAAMFDKSPRWGRERIREARQVATA